MDFNIPEDLKMVQSLVKDFVNDQLKPLEREIMGRAGDLSDARMFLPTETENRLVKMAMDMGLWGVGVPEELGGAGLNTLGNCLVEEELAKTVIPFSFGDVSPILFDCNTEQREKYFEPVLRRERCAYLAFLEPDKKVQLSVGMKAQKLNNHYVLDGVKITFSRAGKNYFAIAFAATDDDSPTAGVTCFLVDEDTPGFSVSSGNEKTGWRSQVREPMSLVFDHCEVPAKNILGEEGKAFYLGKKWLPSRRLVRGAKCIGVAQRLLEESTTQAQSWQSFGQFISNRTSIEAALADMAVGIHACRLMVYEAAWKADSGQSIRREAAMVKVFATQTLYGVADRVTHIFNGPAYVAGLPMERLCRHALATSATELALELQRSIIARDVLKGLTVW